MLAQFQMVEALKLACERDENVLGGMLFGSFTLGEADEFSDIDAMILVRDEALDAFDKQRWLAGISPVAMMINHEYGFDTVIFENMVRGEFHFAKFSELDLSSSRKVTRFPSLESTLLSDKTGKLASELEAQIGDQILFGTTDQEVQDAFGRMTNWLLFGINLLQRGEYAHAMDISRSVQHHLVRIARILESKTTRWQVPAKFLERDLSPEAYARLADCTSSLDAQSLWQAYRNSWVWALEMLPELTSRYHASIPQSVVDGISAMLR